MNCVFGGEKHDMGGWALEQALQGAGHGSKSVEVQEVFGQCSQT